MTLREKFPHRPAVSRHGSLLLDRCAARCANFVLVVVLTLFVWVGTADVLELIQDRAWLTKVTATIYGHWHKQNAARKQRTSLHPTNGSSATSASNVALAC